MSPLSLWRFVTSALVLLLVFAAVADAGPMKARGTKALSSAKTTSAKKTTKTTDTVQTSSTKSKATSKTSSKVAKSTKKATSTKKKAKLSSAPTGVAKAAKKSASDVFCASFVKQCFDSALSGQTGDVHVIHSCKRNGKKDSESYTYSCKRGKTDLTKVVLNALADDYTVYTTLGSTVVITGTDTVIQTDYYTTTTTSQSAEATATVTSIASTATSIEVIDVPSTLQTLTTVIPVTITTAYPATATVTTTTTSTVSQVFIGQDQINTYDVVVSDDTGSRRRRAVAGFCSTYATACASECANSSSEVRKSVCDAHKAPRYTVACVCKNGKEETQHALAALVEDSNVVSITTVATSTSYLTATQTSTLPTAVVSVQAVTLTTTIPSTTTFTTLSTSTIASTSTAFTGLSVTLGTTSTPTTVQTNTATSIVSTTTNIVLAATGYARGFSTADGTDLGLFGTDSDGQAQLSSFEADATSILFMAVRDPSSGLYQLAQYGEPDQVIYSEYGFSGDTYESGSAAYSWLYFGSSSNCGSSGTAAGSAAGSDDCETFVFSPLGLDETPGSDTNTANMESTWINSDGSQYTGAWTYDQATGFAYQVADAAAFSANYQETNTPFNLRFPYTS